MKKGTLALLWLIIICLSLVIPAIVFGICNADIHISYHVYMDNNTMEAIKSINYSVINNIPK